MSLASILPGTLDMLVLKAVSLGREHGYGVLNRIQRASSDVLVVEQGALYPALARLEAQGLIEAEWGISENNRRAKFYQLSRDGRARLKADIQDWRRFSAALDQVLATPSLGAMA
ncbi:MAG: PadR family transcriptional regulator [Ahniella sp.]|nr:PadR family transcriptional regulator [Ahniella sp.]